MTYFHTNILNLVLILQFWYKLLYFHSSIHISQRYLKHRLELKKFDKSG